MIVYFFFGAVILATMLVIVWPERKAIKNPCLECGIDEPSCRLMWVGARKCCPDCTHGPDSDPQVSEQDRAARGGA